jgi:phospholipid/cholesterol/gamma-HCH transport system permease protein
LKLHELAAEPAQVLYVDVAAATAIDALMMALLVEFRSVIVSRGLRCVLTGVSPPLIPVLKLYRGDQPAPPLEPPRRRKRPMEQLAALGELIVTHLREPVSFIGELVASLGLVVRRRARINWRALPRLIERAGADALLIVIVLDFLVGFVVALQATRQLEMLGANIYVADLVGISVTRELVPLITAIILAGRSGASFSAELGTMRVTEEIDALKTMGISPMPYLVLPRVMALAVVSPILALVGDAAAILGGLVVAVTGLDLTADAYFGQLRVALLPSDVWTGLVKSFAFGITIALIGCQEGLATRGSAAAVGRRTTATVVASLFFVVVLDALMTAYYRMVNQ